MKKKKPQKKANSTKKTSKDLKTLLGEFMQKISSEQILEKDEVFKAWYDTIGARFSPQTKPLFLSKGVLVVQVQGGRFVQLFECTSKTRIIKKNPKTIP